MTSAAGPGSQLQSHSNLVLFTQQSRGQTTSDNLTLPSSRTSSRHGEHLLLIIGPSVDSTHTDYPRKEKGLVHSTPTINRCHLPSLCRLAARLALPSKTSSAVNTPSTYTNASTAAPSKSVPLGPSSPSSTLPKRQWAPPTSGSILS